MAILAFEDLCRMDPRIRDLENDVREFSDLYGKLSPRCANAAWYGYGRFWGKGFKPRLLKLVGFAREPQGYVEPVLPPLPFVVACNDPILDQRSRLLEDAYADAVERLPREAQGYEDVLGSPEAYDLVYDHLYQLLPECSGCMCM